MRSALNSNVGRPWHRGNPARRVPTSGSVAAMVLLRKTDASNPANVKIALSLTRAACGASVDDVYR